ncbi:hypothetical protein AAHA92_24789 [Salvia divinorum]|uniref:EF-hand domain-containing protein n=1 Tax=Salvia divinorum TaxID=28513 RepID=A0ABD1G8M8_SALDI
MALIRYPNRVLNCHGKVELTMEEFKKWLKKFDEDGDGRISVEELREAIHATGGWFCKRKAKRVLKAVDTNSDGFIDESEMPKLVLFAQKQFGLRVVGF